MLRLLFGVEFTDLPRADAVRGSLRFPAEWRCRRTLKRRLNLYLNRWEHLRLTTSLKSYPWILSVEPTNACNLRCPFCFTGAGGVGRRRTMMSMELFEKLLAEIGDYLILLKAYRWGEPLLCGHLEMMIGAANAKGICTLVNTTLSLPITDERAEALVASGLDHLIVAVDGARQETHERYRRGGDLATVLDNVRRLNDAKRRLRSETPHMRFEFHPFPWSAEDAAGVRALAERNGVGLQVFKGCVPGDEWDTAGTWNYCAEPTPFPCHFLWTTASVSADGAVAPCDGAFYAHDDMGRLAVEGLGDASFRTIWNNERFRYARSLFRRREAHPQQSDPICLNCPNTVVWERWKEHRRAAIGSPFELGYTTNDIWNYFWNRRPPGAIRAHADWSSIKEPRRAAS